MNRDIIYDRNMFIVQATGGKGLPGPSTQPYFAKSQIAAVKSFVTLAPADLRQTKLLEKSKKKNKQTAINQSLQCVVTNYTLTNHVISLPGCIHKAS
jgi:hypothetical protein